MSAPLAPALVEDCLLRGVAGLARAVHKREIRAIDVARAQIARIERLNPALNALIGFDPQRVLDDARLIDQRIDGGESLRLAGVPYTVKDNLWVEGRRITQGSKLFADFVAPRDAWAVARMRSQGALLLGISNCSEFACKGITSNPLHGTTRNPWDPALSPGGSSGGAAAAVAAGIGLFALATDAGGSTRRPAAHCGVVGMKPSTGIVPHPWGFEEPNFGVSVIGQIAASVADAAEVLQALAAFEPLDPLSARPHDGRFAAAAGGSEAGDVAEAGGIVETAGGAGVARGGGGAGGAELAESGEPAETGGGGSPPKRLRVAWSPQLGCGFAVDDDVARAFDEAIGRLRDDGWAIVDAEPPWPPGIAEYPALALQQAGLAALYADRLPGRRHDIDPDLVAQIEAGMRFDGATIARTLLRREAVQSAVARFFTDFDLLLTPTAPVTAWPATELGPATIGGRPAGPRGHAGFTPLFNYAGVPACSVPVALVRGLPIGLQVVGPRLHDARVIAAAAAIERKVGRFTSAMRG
ncbi:MAG TPA: amidase [Burkholderiaceae bacterium]|nr:amidase [Burkholderiaceae bacterium]